METGSALERMLCFGLYSASHRIGQVYRELLAPWRLTYTQYLVLVALWEQDGRAVGELGDLLGLDSGTLSPLLKRLEGRGLLTRARSAKDERVVEVTLTERGSALRSELADIPACLGERMGLDLAGADELLDRIHALSASLLAPAGR